MDLTTKYLGFDLSSPLVIGASPVAVDLDAVRKGEDAGAAAVVMNSLFEEQITGEVMGGIRHVEEHAESSGEARSFFPSLDTYRIGPEDYLEQIQKIKKAVKVPVIGSLNGVTVGGWLDYAKLMEEAGADGLELNVYSIATDTQESSSALENRVVEILRTVKRNVKIPVAVKLSPYFTSLANFAYRLDEAGADGLVIFNRFYQPDIDVENLEVVRTLRPSGPTELLIRIRWIAILSGRVKASLSLSGGVYTGLDAIKSVMAGAHSVQMVAALLQRGPEHIKTVKAEMQRWMEEHEYESLKQMQGSMNLLRCPDPKAYERGNYVQILQTWQV